MSAEMRPPNSEAVLRRLIILKYVILKALLVPPPEMLAETIEGWSERKKEKFASVSLFPSNVDTLRQSGLWEEMEDWERELMFAGTLESKPQSIIDASWRMEAAACLMWALGYLDEMPPFDKECDPRLIKMVPNEPSSGNSPRLRAHADIEQQREIAELWHWRARTRQLIEDGEMPDVLPDGQTIEQVLQLLTDKMAREGILPRPIEDDFPAMNKAYRDLGPDEYVTVRSIAQERHFALNWLCGYAPGNRWSETPTDT